MLKKRSLIIFIVSILLLSVALRIFYVNYTAEQQQKMTFSMGKWVPLNGDFHLNIEEYTDSYEVNVKGAEILTYSEFINKYDGTLDAVPEAERPAEVLDLTVAFKRKNSSQTVGGVLLMEYFLQNEDGNELLQYNSELLSISVPELQGAYTASLASNSEYEMHIPYTLNQRGSSELKDVYYLVVSKMPVKKMIKIYVSQA